MIVRLQQLSLSPGESLQIYIILVIHILGTPCVLYCRLWFLYTFENTKMLS